jgi:WD repeat and FYVE domain-containing protein 3
VNKFSLNQIRNIEKRRYLLQPIGLELFLANGRTYLLAFERSERQRALQRILQYAPQARTADASQMMDGLTKKWENGEISNFEYLVILNTWAGRTYNDLMQYPIFPWVIADYDSSVLDSNRVCERTRFRND